MNREVMQIDTDQSEKFLLASYNTGLLRKASFLDKNDQLQDVMIDSEQEDEDDADFAD